jgi:hypothetical protein
VPPKPPRKRKHSFKSKKVEQPTTAGPAPRARTKNVVIFREGQLKALIDHLSTTIMCPEVKEIYNFLKTGESADR